MRIRLALLMIAPLLALAAGAAAQSAPPEKTPPSTTPIRPQASVQLGVRGTDISGDAARFQRYRDLGDGAFLETFRFDRAKDAWAFELAADHVGRKDQRYFGEIRTLGKVRASFEWNQIPLLISRDTRTLYVTESPGVLRIDDSIQRGIQNREFTIADVVGRAQRFDTRNRRDTATFKLVYTPARDVDVKFDLSSAKREGSMPWGASFGFNHAVEVPVPIDTRTTDAKMGVEWANARGLVRLGYDGSWFTNHIQILIWDNPLKFTDSTYTAPVPAYVDGRGTSQGRMALWPSSTMHTVHSAASIKLPGRSRLTGNVAIGAMKQNESILPHTINSALPPIPLERSTAEAEARTIGTNVAWTARPTSFVWLNARYRYYDFDNRTPHFPVERYVRLDQGYAELRLGGSKPLSIKRHNVDVDASFTPMGFTALKVGYGRAQADRTFRIFETTAEDTFRASLDTTGNQYVTLRTVFEHATRSGEAFDAHALDIVGEQPGMRHFDVANRDRNRVTAIVTLTPTGVVGFTASIAAGQDDYKESEFGLRDNDHRIYTIGVDAVPRDEVAFGLSYGYENYTALQNSRQASRGPQFVDPLRNWSIDSDDRAHTVNANLDLVRLFPKTELRLGYDFSRSRSTYLYGVAGPAERTLPDGSPIVGLLPIPQQLPPVKNELQRGTVDAQYFLTERVALGVVYWYDRYRVQDFALGSETISRIDLPAGILLEYLYRPYRAHSAWLRLTYLW